MQRYMVENCATLYIDIYIKWVLVHVRVGACVCALACVRVRVCLYLKFLESLKCNLHKSTLLISIAHFISFIKESNLRNHKTEWSC